MANTEEEVLVLKEIIKKTYVTLFEVDAEQILVVDWHAVTPDNRLDFQGVKELSEVLDEVEKRIDLPSGIRGLIFTAGRRKHFSNGFDLANLAKLPMDEDREHFVQGFAQLLARILTLPIQTVACVNGHAYGGGLVLAAAFDIIVMNQERGWLCMPAISLGITLPRGLLEVLRRRLSHSHHLLNEVIYQGQQFSARDALSKGIIEDIAPLDQLLATGMKKFPPSPLNVKSLKTTKMRLHHNLLALLENTTDGTPGLHSSL